MEKLYKSEEILEAYIGTPKKFFWYKNTFSKYDVNGIEKFAWVWSWWASIGGVFYLLYRKCYVEALIIWILGIVLSFINPYAYFIFSIISGGVLPYLVYKRYRKIITQVEQVEIQFEKQLEMVKSLGGVNKVARTISIVLLIIIMLMSGVVGFYMGYNGMM